MARNVAKKREPGQAPTQETPPPRGGTPGGPVSAQARAETLPGTMLGARRAEAPTPRQFEVVRSPGMVGYPGQGKTILRVGKVVSDASCDLDHLRRQGVVLQEIIPVQPPAPEPEETEVEEEEKDETADED